jgi:hypothetical protein
MTGGMLAVGVFFICVGSLVAVSEVIEIGLRLWRRRVRIAARLAWAHEALGEAPR